MSRPCFAIAMACLLLTACGMEPESEPPAPAASQPASPEGISRDDAVEAARDAVSEMVGDAEGWQVGAVTAGPFGQVAPGLEHHDWARAIPTDRRVWRVDLRSGDVSGLVVTDFVDGSVYGVVVGIAD